MLNNWLVVVRKTKNAKKGVCYLLSTVIPFVACDFLDCPNFPHHGLYRLSSNANVVAIDFLRTMSEA